MNDEEFLKLTNTLYNLTEYISDEPLKNRIREKALGVFSNLSLIFSKNPKASFKEKNELAVQVEKDIEVLENCLKLACSREYLHSFNFLIVKNEYDKIKKGVKEFEIKEDEVKECEKQEKSEISEMPETPEIPENNIVDKNVGAGEASVRGLTSDNISERQRRILKILKEKEKAQIQNLKEFFLDTSKRTLRRDLDELLKKGLVIRTGEWNQIFYQLKKDRTEDRTGDRTGDRTE